MLVRRLAAAREQAGLTQVEAARRLGHTQSFVAKCERLYRRVDMLELLHLLRLYRVAPQVFFRPWTRDEVHWMEQLRRQQRAAERRR